MTPITPAMTPARSASPLTVSIASAVSGCRLTATSTWPWYGIAATNVPPSAVPLDEVAAGERGAHRLALESRGRRGAPVGPKSSSLSPCCVRATRSRVAGVTFCRAAARAWWSARLSP